MNNKMKEVAKLLSREIGVPFDVCNEDGNYLSDSPFTLTEKGLMDNGGWRSDSTLLNLITGNYTIKDIPFEPKHGEKYWTIDIENDLIPFYFKTTWVDNKFDYKQKLLGLVFRTREEVDAYSPTFKARLKEVGVGRK